MDVVDARGTSLFRNGAVGVVGEDGIGTEVSWDGPSGCDGVGSGAVGAMGEVVLASVAAGLIPTSGTVGTAGGVAEVVGEDGIGTEASSASRSGGVGVGVGAGSRGVGASDEVPVGAGVAGLIPASGPRGGESVPAGGGSVAGTVTEFAGLPRSGVGVGRGSSEGVGTGGEEGAGAGAG